MILNLYLTQTKGFFNISANCKKKNKQMQKTEILFENNEILVINKIYGLSVQGGSGVSHSLDQDLSKELGYKIYLVHRLDKETSGLLLVAKNPKAAAKWTNLIASKDVKKEYLAVSSSLPVINGKKMKSGTLESSVLAHGKTQNAKTFFNLEREFFVELSDDKNAGETDSSCGQPPVLAGNRELPAKPPVLAENRELSAKPPVLAGNRQLPAKPPVLAENRQLPAKPPVLAENRQSTDIRKFSKETASQQRNQNFLQADVPLAKSSKSEKSEKDTKKIPLYLIRLTLQTGRMHQIRIQMANANAPLIADDKYGDFKLNKILRKIGIKKLQLASVKLTLPVNKKSVVLECKLPPHMQNLLDKNSN